MHATARLIQGGTIHTFVARQAASFQGTILIDEISMVQLPLLAALDQLRADGKCRIICFGDFRQLPPVGNSWRGTTVNPSILQNSRLFKLWCDSTVFTLRRCRRCDPVHFNFYMNLPGDLRTAIKICKRNYQNTQEDADTHLVISHRHRRAISLEKQAAAAVGQQTVLIPAGDDPEYKCFVGTRLVGSCTNHTFINGARYTVLCILPTIIYEMI